MIPLLSGDCEGSDRIRLDNSVKYYAKHSSRSHDAVICVYDEPGNELDEADLYWGRIAIQDWQ